MAKAMLQEALGGMMTRPEGFCVKLSTHSDDAPSGVFADELKKARGVRDGTIEDNSYLPVLYEWPKQMLEDQAYLDPKNFYVTNPAIGDGDKQAILEADLQTELAGEGDGIQLFLSKFLNVQIGTRLSRDRWRGAEFWDGAAVPWLRDLDSMLDRAEVVVIGIDGGGLDDLTGFCALGRDKFTGVWMYWTHAWAHRIVLERRKEIAAQLHEFEADGDLTFWGGTGASVSDLLDDKDGETFQRSVYDADVTGIVELCVKVRDSHLLPEFYGIGVDPASIGAIVKALTVAEFSVVTPHNSKGVVFSVAQNATNMFSAICTMERMLEAGTAAHGGTRLMQFCVGNAKAELKGNAVAITKQLNGRGKIDPLSACMSATKVMEGNPEAKGASVYASRGLIRV
jgi:phage terminase large subunit-like protein